MHDIWNPWHGCVKCSEGCEHCYMYFLDKQRDRNGADIYRTKTAFDYPLQKKRGGCCALSKDIVEVSYPIGLTLDENGEPNIDPKGGRISRNSVEVRIPLDNHAAMMIFRDKKDYELEWAVKYLDKNARP